MRYLQFGACLAVSVLLLTLSAHRSHATCWDCVSDGHNPPSYSCLPSQQGRWRSCTSQGQAGCLTANDCQPTLLADGSVYLGESTGARGGGVGTVRFSSDVGIIERGCGGAIVRRFYKSEKVAQLMARSRSIAL
jgi:hypothetical protein